MLESVKLLLGIDNDESDERLNLILELAENKLKAYLPNGVEAIPYDLEYIVIELAVARYNRLGNEAMDSYSQDGESITYSDDDMKPYIKDVQAWIDANEYTEGVVVFI